LTDSIMLGNAGTREPWSRSGRRTGCDRSTIVDRGGTAVLGGGHGSNACDGSDPGQDVGADVVAWCEQLDVAFRASAGIAALDRDDPGLGEALATMQDEMAALVDLERRSRRPRGAG